MIQNYSTFTMKGNIDLTTIGNKAFDYFPEALLTNIVEQQGLRQEYNNHISKLHTNDLFDVSLVKAGVLVEVITSKLRGITANCHLTEIGKRNGGIEVNIDGTFSYFYPHQIKLARGD